MSEQNLPGPSELEFGRHVRKLRQALGLEVEQLAQRCRLDAEVIQQLERGEHEADVDTLTELAEALGVRLSVLFKLWETRAFGADEDN